MFTRVISGEFRRDTAEASYAEAFSAYWVAFMTDRADVTDRWLDAFQLKPNDGFAARQLLLPDNPVDPAGVNPASQLLH